VATLARAAPSLIRTVGLKAYSLLTPLQLAVRDRLTMKAQGLNLDNFLRQTGLFGTPALTAGEPLAQLLLRIFVALEASAVKFARVLRRYLALSLAPGRGQTGLFAEAVLSPLEALSQAAREAAVNL
jgi:hypothetical protein